jgi:hypothetical protein
MLRSIEDVRRICRLLDPYLGSLTLDQINGDVIWSVVQGEFKKGNKPATVNRYLATVRSLLRMARDEWQWIDSIPESPLVGRRSRAGSVADPRGRRIRCL